MKTDIRQLIIKLQQICSRQEKCTADITDYLVRHQIPEEYHQTVITSLVAEKFIDDERYARAAVQDKFKLNRWGRIKIRYFLRSKHISEEAIEKAMNLIDEDDYRRMLEQEMKKKASGLAREKAETRKAKLLQFAASRGFEQDLVWKII